MTSAARFWPRFVCVAAVCLAGCARDGEPASSPPAHAAAVDVPPPPAATRDDRDRRTRPAERRVDSEPSESGELDFEITYDGGAINLSSSGDGGVRVWGTLTRHDGGFNFQGGFSAGAAVDGGP